MIFGWEGFWFEHPEDWAPATISGTRDEGYVRIASGGRVACQVRWKRSSSAGDLDKKLDAYLAKLKKDNKKSFESGTDSDGEHLRYYYSGDLTGKGAIFYDEPTKRVFFIELSSTKNDRLGTPLKSILGSFGSGRERWALYGLDVNFPDQIKIEKKVFLSGKTQLMFARRGVVLEAQRWAFGKQLIEKHGLEPWARAALSMKTAIVDVEDTRLELSKKLFLLPETRAVAVYQEERNQIVTLKVRSRINSWRPTWDWLN